MPKNGPIIRVKDLSYTYPDGTEALKNIEFNVEKGQWFVVMGPNGAGKTTLSQTMNGIIPHILGGEIKGEVNVAGKNPFRNPVYTMAEKVGIILQRPDTQLFCNSIRNEVAFAAENLGMPKEEILNRLEWALDLTRLSGTKDRSPTQLSGGQQQRLVIAANILCRPDVLVLDEPTSQLDPMGTERIFSVLKELQEKENMTLLHTSHKSKLIAEFADRVMLINKGEKRLEADTHHFFNHLDLLNDLYIQIPDVTELCKRLDSFQPLESQEGLMPVTLEEGIKRISDMVNVGRIRIGKEEKPFQSKMPSQETLLQVKNLHFTYPSSPPVKALKGINLEIKKGEFVGIIGQNGSGKTTMVKNITGVLEPTEGDILFKGKNIKELKSREIAREIGLVLQNPDKQLFKMSVEEEVGFGLEKLDIGEEEKEQRIQEALEMTGLQDVRELHPYRLSYGERRKLCVAAIKAMNPSLLILDEPITGQDWRGRLELSSIARTLNEQLGTTILMITHDMNLIAQFTDRAIVMGKGKKLLDAPTREVLNNPEVLSETYLSPPQITQLAIQLKQRYDNIASNVITVEELCNQFSPRDE